MAREAYRSLYGDLTKLKDTSLLDDPASGNGYDDEMFQLLMSISEAVDRYLNTNMYPLTTTRYYNGSGKDVLLIDNLVSLTTIKADEDRDKTYEVTWSATDYWLQPYNAEPTKHWGFPYTSILVRKDGTKAEFIEGQQMYEVTGIWGSRQLTEDSGTDLNDASMTTAKTTWAVDDGTQFAIGQTIMAGNEQALVTDISSNNLTVTRGINGTTAEAHADDTDIYILRWPAPVERATLITTARIWTRAPAFEPFYVDADIDTDVRWMLEPYRKLPA